jgi:iron complex transport system substrate-binding protein
MLPLHRRAITVRVGLPLAFILLLAFVSQPGCNRHPPQVDEERALVSATDALGRRISLSKYPDRIISTAPSNTEILLALGLRDKLVGVTTFYGYPENVEGIPRIGGYTNPSVAKIVSLHPDIVFAARGNPNDVIQQLREQRITVFTIDTVDVSGLLVDLRKVGSLTGAVEHAEGLVSQIEEGIRRIRGRVRSSPPRENPRVLWIGQEQPLRTAGHPTLVNELILIAGGDNVAADEKSRWPSYTMEKLVLHDPQVIILSEDKYKNSPTRVAQTLARFRRENPWKQISAVRTGRVHYIPTDLLGQATPALLRGVEMLARRLHPELFPDPQEQPDAAAMEEGT